MYFQIDDVLRRTDYSGKTFTKHHDSIDDIEKGVVAIPEMPHGCEYSKDEINEMVVLVSRLIISGVFQFPAENRLNEQFPDLRPTKMKDLLTEAWKDR